MASNTLLKKPTKGREEITVKLKWLMYLRIAVVTFLIGADLIVYLKLKGPPLDKSILYLLATLISVYFLTLIYALLFHRIGNKKAFTYIQILCDLFIITGLIYITGGIESNYFLLYFLAIMAASMILYRRGSLMVASLCCILYGTLTDLEFYHILEPFQRISYVTYEPYQFFYKLSFNIIIFYFIAILTSYLAEQVKKTRDELKEKEMDYTELEALTNDILSSINSGILTIDKGHRIKFYNKAAEKITGIRAEETYGLKVGKIFPPLEANGAIQVPAIGRSEISFRKRSGENLYFEFSVSTLRSVQGEEKGKILCFEDITKLKDLEESLKISDRLAALGKMAAGLAHEIRNPLASLSGSIQVLKGELSVDGKSKKLMNIILREINRLNQLITDFLLYAKVQSLVKELVDLNAIITETLEIFERSPDLSNAINIKKNFRKGVKVMGDPKQLKQVLWNMLVNAVQAMSHGGQMEIRTKLTNEDSIPYAEISIGDTGCGVEPENITKIFDPFFSTKERGIGLGLATAYSIIEMHHGRIHVESQAGKGTIFRILLQMENSDA